MIYLAYICIVSLFLVPGGSSVAHDPPKQVALLTGMSGGVTLLRSDGEVATKAGARLLEGDVVRVGNGFASLVFLSGELVTLSDGEGLTLGATMESSVLDAAGVTRGLTEGDGLNVADNIPSVADDNDVWQAQLASVSGIRGDADAIAVSPRLTISDARPVFCWFDTDSAATGDERKYLLVLRNASGQGILQQEVKGKVGTFCTWRPETMPEHFFPAPRAQYSWTILPIAATVPDGVLDASFVYVDQEGIELANARRDRLQALHSNGSLDEMSLRMLRCVYALDDRERLFSDAVADLLFLAAMPISRPYATEQLSRMFLRFGNQVSVLAPLLETAPEDMFVR